MGTLKVLVLPFHGVGRTAAASSYASLLLLRPSGGAVASAFFEQCRWQHKLHNDKSKEIDILRERPFRDLNFGEKVKQTGKDATYLTVIVAGLGVTGIMFYMVARELFSSDSPNGVYTKAVKRCQMSPEVLDAIGEPMKAHGEMTRRGRRQHPSFAEFNVGERKAMRMKFYLEGSIRNGTVHLEVRKNDQGQYEYEYLIVELDNYSSSGRQIVVEKR